MNQEKPDNKILWYKHIKEVCIIMNKKINEKH